MAVLDSINDPADLRRVEPADLPALAAELRTLLVDTVCRTGGHLGPNLGVVELSIALHRVFESPRVPLVFDTGHQTYVHKVLTGRRAELGSLRTAGGLSGYPNRRESPHDVVENSHASTALSYADGLAKAFALTGRGADPVVALIGDGALTGGLAFEALNNIGAGRRNVIVLVNDNGLSYSQTAGGLAAHLVRLADREGYLAVADRLAGGQGTAAVPTAGSDSPAGGVFAALGFDYLGPIDGHDIAAVESALRLAARRGGPIVVHARTRKGNGYAHAEDEPADHMHTIGTLDPATGRPLRPAGMTWTDAFADALVQLGDGRPDLVAITAAMAGPTGLQRFGDRYPQRCFDVGIAEAHAVTSAAGMALAGLHPVVALYATFAGRAFDELMMDVGLHALPVTLVLDRAGITGPDGPSHHGIWDLAMFGIVPGMRVAAPRDAASLIDELGEAVATTTGPTTLRFPKAGLGRALPAVERVGGADVLVAAPGADVLLVGVGALCGAAVVAAEALAGEGISCAVVDPRWVLPPDPELVALAARHRLVVTVEDGVRDGGAGTRLAAALADLGAGCLVRNLGLPTEFVPHGERAELLAQYGLDAAGIADAVRREVARSAASTTATPATSGAAPTPHQRRGRARDGRDGVNGVPTDSGAARRAAGGPDVNRRGADGHDVNGRDLNGRDFGIAAASVADETSWSTGLVAVRSAIE